MNITSISGAWQALISGIGEMRVPESEEQYRATVKLLDALLDATRGDQNHALASLVALVGDLVATYERKHLQETNAPPAEVLRLLMVTNNLKQTDLSAEVGGQSVVSELLSGKRRFNAKQASALAQRFGVSPALFIEAPPPMIAQVEEPQDFSLAPVVTVQPRATAPIPIVVGGSQAGYGVQVGAANQIGTSYSYQGSIARRNELVVTGY